MGIAKENLNSKEAKRAKAKIQGGGMDRVIRAREEESAKREVGREREGRGKGRDRKRQSGERERDRESHTENMACYPGRNQQCLMN